jgi:DNA-(apurinic or apyrimidinic site) lyase
MHYSYNHAIIDILQEIPFSIWNRIVQYEPEWRYFNSIKHRFANHIWQVIYIMMGLNAYQLKGRAEEGYWLPLSNYLANLPLNSPLTLIQACFLDFYKFERLPKNKIKRVHRFCSSRLFQELVNNDTKSNNIPSIPYIWNQLAQTMKQNPTDKTIVFALKCLGVHLLMEQVSGLDFSTIPIPVDSRIRQTTARLTSLILSDKAIQNFWSSILHQINQHLQTQITMIHLDSLLWQISLLQKEELGDYCTTLGLGGVESDLANVLFIEEK